MSTARLIHILSILQQKTNAEKALTLHEIHTANCCVCIRKNIVPNSGCGMIFPY